MPRTARDLAVEAQTDRRLQFLFERFGCEEAGQTFLAKGKGKGKDKGGK